MIKICYVIGQLGKGGAEKQLFELVKGIDRKRFHPIVISFCQGEYWSREIKKLNTQVLELKKNKMKLSRLFVLTNLLRLLKSVKPDIIHTYMLTANFYGRVAAVIARVPVIIASERSLVELGKDKNLYLIYKLLAVVTSGIICNSNKTYESLVIKYSIDRKKVFTVHNGINVSEYFKGKSLKNRGKLTKHVIGTVGRLYPVKNHRYFLDIAKVILEAINDKSVKFLIVGGGPLKNVLESYSKKLGIENNIEFAGDRNDIADLLQRMDIFVMTSLYEGFPNAIMEAMGIGLPVVATDVGGIGELVIDGETGFLCQSNDANALAKKVMSLLNNGNEAKRMGENGRKRILNEFGVERMVKETENIYMNLLEQKK